MNEVELAKVAVKHFREKGYDVYQEVKTSRKRTVDIVVMKNDIRASIECKMQGCGGVHLRGQDKRRPP
jgi:Holliday junction resolvase